MRFMFHPALPRVLRAGYRLSDLSADIGAGMLVGVVALPLAMAFAIASGCKPEQGLFTAIIGSLIVGLLGGSRVQIAGPTGAFVALCASAVAHYGYSGLALATLMAGVLLLVMGVCRLGKAIEFIPIPVVIGFTSGIAVVIASTQVKDACGLSYDGAPGEFIPRIALVWQHAAQVKWIAVILTLTTVAIMVLIRVWRPRYPAALIAIIACSSVAWLWHLDVATIASRFGMIPHALPMPGLTDLGLGGKWTMAELAHRLYELRWLAIAIALLGAIESLLSAVVADGMSGDRHDSDTELVAQGFANLASPWFLGLPVTGAIARTATNIRAGAVSPVSAIVHALSLMAIMIIAAPLASHIPLACLAGVLLVVCWNMAEVHLWPLLMRTKRSDAFLLLMAFLLTVFVDLTVAVITTTLVGMLLFVKRMADMTTMEPYHPGAGDQRHQFLPMGLEIGVVRGPFFFGAASMIRQTLDRISPTTTILILDIRNVPFIDATAVFAIRDLLGQCRRRRISLVMCEVQDRPMAVMSRAHLVDEIGRDRIFKDLDAAVAAGRRFLIERRDS